MCGRFTLTSTPEELARRFGLDAPPPLAPRYNIAPGQDVLAVRRRADGRRRADLLRWGLVPSFSPDPSVGGRMINARVETAAGRPAFREALRHRRCLVPADGFYEWADRGGARQPFHVALREGVPFGLAGLWERWRDPAGGWLESCTLLTAPAAPALRDLHDRMPIVVAPGTYAAWLDVDACEPASLLGRLYEEAATAFRVHAVSTRVNRADRDEPGCIEPVPELPRQGTLF